MIGEWTEFFEGGPVTFNSLSNLVKVREDGECRRGWSARRSGPAAQCVKQVTRQLLHRGIGILVLEEMLPVRSVPFMGGKENPSAVMKGHAGLPVSWQKLVKFQFVAFGDFITLHSARRRRVVMWFGGRRPCDVHRSDPHISVQRGHVFQVAGIRVGDDAELSCCGGDAHDQASFSSSIDAAKDTASETHWDVGCWL